MIINRYTIRLSLTFFMFFYSLPAIVAQEMAVTESEITIREMRLPVKPRKSDTSKYFSIEDEVAIIISDMLMQLNIYGVTVGICLDSASKTHAMARGEIIADSKIVNIEDITYADEVLLVNIQEFCQHGIPQQKDSSADAAYFEQTGSGTIMLSSLFNFFRKSSKNKGDKYPYNIQSRLSVLVYQVDVKTGYILHSFPIEVTHTGGSRAKSKKKMLKKLETNVSYQLKWLYWLSSGVTALNNGKVELPLGNNDGVRKGMLFELVNPEITLTEAGQETIIPERSGALISVYNDSSEKCQLRILRQWHTPEAGCWAVEWPEPVSGLQFNASIPVTDSYAAFGIQFNARAIKNIDGGFALRLVRVTDSFDEHDWGVSFGGFGLYRFINSSKLDLGLKSGIDFDIVFKTDDADRTVSTGLFSAFIGLTAEILISQNYDIVVNAGYRFGAKSDKWDDSEEEETYPAFWFNDAPEVDNSGFYLSIGYKFMY